MHGPVSPKVPLVSEFADDPAMLELVTQFLAELSSRIDSIEHGLRNGDTVRVRRIAHQLKGSAGGFGFPTIGQAAALVEERLEPRGGPEPDLGRAAGLIESLLECCRTAVGSGHAVIDPDALHSHS